MYKIVPNDGKWVRSTILECFAQRMPIVWLWILWGMHDQLAWQGPQIWHRPTRPSHKGLLVWNRGMLLLVGNN